MMPTAFLHTYIYDYTHFVSVKWKINIVHFGLFRVVKMKTNFFFVYLTVFSSCYTKQMINIWSHYVKKHLHTTTKAMHFPPFTWFSIFLNATQPEVDKKLVHLLSLIQMRMKQKRDCYKEIRPGSLANLWVNVFTVQSDGTYKIICKPNPHYRYVNIELPLFRLSLFQEELMKNLIWGKIFQNKIAHCLVLIDFYQHVISQLYFIIRVEVTATPSCNPPTYS